MNAARLKRTSLLKVTLVALAAMVAACLLTLVATEKSAQAVFPGQNGQIAYLEWNDGQPEIHTVYPDGSPGTVHHADPSTGHDQDLAWSPDGTKLAFQRFVYDHNRSDLYIVNSDGSGLNNLTDSPERSESAPFWSPAGKLAFAGGDGKLYIMKPEGTGVETLADMPERATEFVWSPDGTKIAFASDRDGDYEIYVMNPDGTELTQLTNSPTFDFRPSWSPDGMNIAFTSTRDGDSEVYVMDADGSNQTNLTQYSVASDDHPAWSPDGKKIAFISDRELSQDSTTLESAIYVMNADGTGDPTRITGYSTEKYNLDWQSLLSAKLPTSKAQCKQGGYKDFGFKNQGQCVAFVQRGAKSE